jgi:hypothetical protein
MHDDTDERLAECLDMAGEARRKADSSASLEDERFWLRMEQRWLLLAKTYRETAQLAHAWLRIPDAQGASN